MAISQNFPEEGPTLNLNFAGSRTLDPRITFTRTSSATYMGRDGLVKIAPANSARFDHRYNSTTGEVESLGLLIEEARTNLLTDTETFDSGWTKFNGSSVTTNATISPDGNQTATKYDYNNSSGVLRRIVGYNPSTTYTVSAFLKAAEIKYLTFLILEKTGIVISMKINLETGEFLDGSQGLPATRTLTYYGNGWYRASITFTTTSDPGAGSYFDFRLADSWPTGNIGGPLNNPVPGQGIYIWGAQLEQGSFPTSYIPTTTSTVTRTADNVSMVGENFSSWYNQSEGTTVMDLYREYAVPPSNFMGGVQYRNSINNGQSRISMGYLTESLTSFEIWENNVDQTRLFPGTFIGVRRRKVAAVYKKNDFSIVTNSSPPTISTSGNVPSDLDSVLFGAGLGGTISTIRYYPRRLSNAQLQTLTR
jgi:hypothetical protein